MKSPANKALLIANLLRSLFLLAILRPCIPALMSDLDAIFGMSTWVKPLYWSLSVLDQQFIGLYVALGVTMLWATVTAIKDAGNTRSGKVASGILMAEFAYEMMIALAWTLEHERSNLG